MCLDSFMQNPWLFKIVRATIGSISKPLPLYKINFGHSKSCSLYIFLCTHRMWVIPSIPSSYIILLERNSDLFIEGSINANILTYRSKNTNLLNFSGNIYIPNQSILPINTPENFSKSKLPKHKIGKSECNSCLEVDRNISKNKICSISIQ